VFLLFLVHCDRPFVDPVSEVILALVRNVRNRSTASVWHAPSALPIQASPRASHSGLHQGHGGSSGSVRSIVGAGGGLWAGDGAAALRNLDTILGPIDGAPNYALGGDQLAKFRTARAFLLVRLKRFADATTEMVNALNAGGRTALLRAQNFLRNNGFPETQLDGRDSDSLRSPLQACFGLYSCFTRISEEL
jgi:hypothetical protein